MQREDTCEEQETGWLATLWPEARKDPGAGGHLNNLCNNCDTFSRPTRDGGIYKFNGIVALGLGPNVS